MIQLSPRLRDTVNPNTLYTTAAFTGHRHVHNPEETRFEVCKASFDLIKSGITHFLVGGAVGFDCLAGEEIIKIREDEPMVELTVVLPCSFGVFTKKWSVEEERRLRTLMSQANAVIVVQGIYSPDCYKQRNQFLVDNSRYCICYYDTDRFKSGAGQTVRMAEQKGIEVINLFGK